MSVAPSLFAPSASPVLPAATQWVTAAITGEVAVGLCVLAVAFVGLMLMSGRLAIREAVRVAIGCFVLLGSGLIAAGLHEMARATIGEQSPPEPLAVPTAAAPAPLPPANYDPYAGASLRRD